MKSIVLHINRLPEMDVENVVSVYVGKPNKCMCGCSGKYTYSKRNQKYAGTNRGYEVTDDEVNDKRVERVINKMSKDEGEIEVLDGMKGGFIFTKVIGQTQYTIYTL